MSTRYLEIQRQYLQQAWQRSREELLRALPAEASGDCLCFRAFANDCRLCPQQVFCGDQPLADQVGILISLYAARVPLGPIRLQPLKAFRELPGSMPYQAAFKVRAEQALVPHVEALATRQEEIVQIFPGYQEPHRPSGDFCLVLYPLPRLPLTYLFYLPDDEFPAEVTCLYPADAALVLPVDALADVAEYTAERLVELLQAS